MKFIIPYIVLILFWGWQAQASSNIQIPPGSGITEDEFQALVEAATEKEQVLRDLLRVPPQQWQFLNPLVKSSSPYLLLQSTQPIYWKQWSQDTLATAQNANRLIFLSIGFSTCYWCQVMKKESFSNPDLAKKLNENFVNIKVDRELLPELDAYFIQALEAVKGTAGWPVTAILSPDARLLFIDSYIAKETLEQLIQRYATAHSRFPERLVSQAEIMEKIAQSRTTESRDNTSQVQADIKWDAIEQQIIDALDKDSGGLKGEPKFPEATLLLYLLDTLQRSNDAKLLALVQLHLKNMATRGLYDQVHGGFHRYVSDQYWHRPHYEKMLYTQALMIMVFSKAWQLTQEPLYEKVVQHTFRFLVTFMQNSNGSFASAIDAVYKNIEGGYYLYKKDRFGKFSQSELKASETVLYEQNGLVGIHSEQPYSSSFDPIRSELENLKSPDELLIDKKALTSWNSLLIWALSEAWMTFREPIYKTTALAQANALNKYNTKAQTLYRASFGEVPTTPAVFEDYSFLTRAFISLYDATASDIWLERAQSWFQQATTFINDAESTSHDRSLEKQFAREMNFIDGELINPTAVLTESAILLQQRTGKKQYALSKKHLEKELLAYTQTALMRQFYSAKVLRDSALGRLDKVQYFAQGNGKVIVQNQVDCSRAFKVQMMPNWHINSDRPLSDDLIATRLSASEVAFNNVHYPVEHKIYFGEDRNVIYVFEGSIAILADGGKGLATLQLQACSTIGYVCLLPETLVFPIAACQQ